MRTQRRWAEQLVPALRSMEQVQMPTQLSLLEPERVRVYPEPILSDHGPDTWIQVDPNDMFFFYYETGCVSFL